MERSQYCQALRISFRTLSLWLEEEWINPLNIDGRTRYRDCDLARGRLILEMIDDMGLNVASVGVAMELLDQIHGLRSQLQTFFVAIRSLDIESQQKIAEACGSPIHKVATFTRVTRQ